MRRKQAGIATDPVAFEAFYRRLLDSDDVARLEEQIDAESRARRAFEAMAGLPEGERAVLELVAIDQLTVTEAAQALGIRHGTARVRLHRARRALRDVPLVMEGTTG
ncbi:sigma-70 family RNA polymerase sigma factor [Nonomuraea sp. NPDC050691]|uniref:RNA polymerase sigma factor n=1 Tax=Nonomuraea sp. NPDC050691 TaxID=3155661 RepID=UPI0033F3EA36